MTEVEELLVLLRTLTQIIRDTESAAVDAQPEDQLKAPVKQILLKVGEDLGLDVEAYTEVRVTEFNGRPDLGVLVGKLLCGHVELKAPGKGARVERLKGSDRQQWEKFQALPNLIYTDGFEWALYRSGERDGEVIRIETAGRTYEPGDVRQLETLIKDFLSWEPIVPTSPRALAALLAPLCRLLRDDVQAALAEPESAVAQLATEWRQALFPAADDRQFSDAYAQTISYALLLARFEGDVEVRTTTAEAKLRRGHALLAQALRILADPQAYDQLQLGIGLLERVVRAVNVDTLRREDPDLWLYFYEDFLAEYDPKLRKDRGVYYTPWQVIQAQCSLVAKLLRRRFERPLDFASEGVVLLDPGCGTGSYLLKALQAGLGTVLEQQGAGAVPGRASEMARNIHGFEILVGPYAVAHLRVTQALFDAGGELPADGAHIYLTDTLESPHSKPLSTLSIFQKPLADEHRRAQRVKAEVPVIVCMGNPPYDRQQIEIGDNATERKGGWVRFGEHGKDAILEDFLEPVRKAGAGVHLKNLYNDYVYFWRWALWKVFEEKREGDSVVQPASPGIVSFISASSYLRGPGFVGMRWVMRQIFDELWIIDLEGDSLGARKTENIFAIRTPVAIAVGVRYGSPHPEAPATIHYSRLQGSREEKLDRLAGVADFGDLEWKDCFEGWSQPFLPVGEGDYYSWPLLTDVFPWQHSGMEFKRTWAIGPTKELLAERWKALLHLQGAARADAFRETRDRKVSHQYSALDSSARLPVLGGLPEGSPVPPAVRIAYRSFDRQWALVDSRLGDFLRPALWQVNGPRQIYLTTLTSEGLGIGPAATVTALVPDRHHFSGRGGKDVIPLFRDAEASRPNVAAGLLAFLSKSFELEVSAEDVLCYVYALLSTLGYVEKFSEELTVPGPRIPFTAERLLFRQAVDLGRRLVWIHTWGARFRQPSEAAYPHGSTLCEKPIPTKPDTYPNDFSYDAVTRTLRVGEGEFAPVQPEVFNFTVSSLEVVKSWLAYRTREGAGRQPSVLDLIRPKQWVARLTDELLQLLWALEATVSIFPVLQTNLEAVLSGKLFSAAEFPTPGPQERKAPPTEGDEQRTL